MKVTFNEDDFIYGFSLNKIEELIDEMKSIERLNKIENKENSTEQRIFLIESLNTLAGLINESIEKDVTYNLIFTLVKTIEKFKEIEAISSSKKEMNKMLTHFYSINLKTNKICKMNAPSIKAEGDSIIVYDASVN